MIPGRLGSVVIRTNLMGQYVLYFLEFSVLTSSPRNSYPKSRNATPTATFTHPIV
jgi:hypothetical protein